MHGRGCVCIPAIQYNEPLPPWASEWWENSAFGHSDSQGFPVGLVYPRSQLLLYYRADWFAQLGVTPPATWCVR